MNNCKICGEPMPNGEGMFFYHGYSGPCPKPPLQTAKPVQIPKVTWRYVDEGGELALYWENPYENREEKIATFWWPVHPIEKTEEVEKMFETIASRVASVAERATVGEKK